MPIAKRRNQPERQEQIKFSVWLHSKGIWHNANANGAKRTVVTGMLLKRMGMSAGFPDIEIPLPCGGYHGLYIELKPEKGGSLTDAQIGWLAYLREKGYYAVMAHGFLEAKEIVNNYLSLKG